MPISLQKAVNAHILCRKKHLDLFFGLAKDLTIGIGGHLIKDVTGNSHKGLVKKVRLEQIQD